MDDPFGNAICIGVSGKHRGKVFFWDHECEPDPESWDGEVSSAGNIELISGSFSDFVAGLRRPEEMPDKNISESKKKPWWKFW
jgi:hypothetical protein